MLDCNLSVPDTPENVIVRKAVVSIQFRQDSLSPLSFQAFHLFHVLWRIFLSSCLKCCATISNCRVKSKR